MSEDWKIQASFKFGSGQQGLLNVRAGSVEELKRAIDALSSQDVLADVISTSALADALGSVQTAPAHVQPAESPLGALKAAAWAAPSAAPAAAPQPAQAPATVDPNGAPTCIHGVKQLLTKPSKNKPGETWTAWACPAGQHDPTKCGLDFNVPNHLKR